MNISHKLYFYNSINESFNSNIIKDFIINNQIFKYKGKDNNLSIDYFLNIPIYKQQNYIPVDIYQKMRLCLSELYTTYLELLDDDNIKDIYEYSSGEYRIDSIITYLNNEGINKDIITNENLVYSIINKIKKYMHNFSILVKKFINGNFNNKIIDNDVFDIINTHDIDIELVDNNIFKKSNAGELYVSIANNVKYIFVDYKKDEKNINGIQEFYVNSIIGGIDIYRYNNNMNTVFTRSLNIVKMAFNDCQSNIQLYKQGNYEIPYYNHDDIIYLLDSIVSVSNNINNIDCNWKHNFDEFWKTFKNYKDNDLVKVYIINKVQYHTENQNTKVPLKLPEYQKNTNGVIVNNIGDVTDLCRYSIKYIDSIIQNNHNKIYNNMIKNAYIILKENFLNLYNSLKELYSRTNNYAVQTDNFQLQLIISKIKKFISYTVIPTIKPISNYIINRNNNDITTIVNYNKKIAKFNKMIVSYIAIFRKYMN